MGEKSVLYSGGQKGGISKVVQGFWNFAWAPNSQKKGLQPPFQLHYDIFGRTKGVIFKSCPRVPELCVWLLRLEEMFKGDFADMCAANFCWCQWGAEWRVQCRPGREDPHGASRNLQHFLVINHSRYFVIKCLTHQIIEQFYNWIIVSPFCRFYQKLSKKMERVEN